MERPEQALYMNNLSLDTVYEQALALLKELIATPSFSKEEDQTAGIISPKATRRPVPVSRRAIDGFSRAPSRLHNASLTFIDTR